MPNFTPSPALLGASKGGSSPLAELGSKQVEWLKAHEAIRPYLALVAKAASNAHIDPNFQAAILAQENGGFDRWSTNAISSTGAQGIAQFEPGTWAGAWNPYRNKDRNNPSYAIPAQAIFLHMLLKQNGGSMNKAAGAYYGAQDPAYIGGVRGYYNELTSNGIFLKHDASGNPFGPIVDVAGDILHGAEDVALSVPRFLATVLNPSKLSQILADLFALWFRLVWKSFWKYVLAPPFHWLQRAVVYYYENIMGSKDGENQGFLFDIAAPTTVAFWVVGYGILWRNASDWQTKANSADDTPLGKGVNGITGIVAKRNVAAPDKVKEQTPDKPEPKQSEVPLSLVRTVSTTRRRQVAVSTNTAQNRSGGNGSDGTSGSEGAQADSAGLGEEAASIATEAGDIAA
jgi:hypothetical protein